LILSLLRITKKLTKLRAMMRMNSKFLVETCFLVWTCMMYTRISREVYMHMVFIACRSGGELAIGGVSLLGLCPY
jgi:hypothetical protein